MFTNLTFHELQAKLNKNENLKIIDIRSPKSFERGHIKGSINIPYPMWSTLPKFSPEEEVVIICYVGIAGGKSAERLSQSHEKVYNFKGGMAQWKGEIESEQFGSKWDSERIYHLILGFLLLLSLPFSFLNPSFGIGYVSFIALVVIIFGITNVNLIKRLIRSYGFK